MPGGALDLDAEVTRLMVAMARCVSHGRDAPDGRAAAPRDAGEEALDRDAPPSGFPRAGRESTPPEGSDARS
jgi:hypothetical protein